MEPNGKKIRKIVLSSLLAVSLASGAAGTSAMEQGAEKKKGNEMVATRQGFFCNTKALTSAERARWELLTKKLLAKKKATVETEKGFEFQYSPEDVSVAEVAEWVVTESKCCPFFDFHIDLEEEGKLVCLRLTGEQGIKQFIRAEFNVT
jgi:hypothetical protein